MTNTSTKDPYAFNGAPLTKDELSNETVVLLNGKNTPLNNQKHFYIESYGCQMNFSDSEIVASILNNEGYNLTDSLDNANLILLNTCSIRDKAEQTVRKRLEIFNGLKQKNKDLKIGVLGCMAERLKHKFLEEEKMVDMVVGPDSYKDIPNLLKEAESEREAVNVILSKEETYGDIVPVRLASNGVSAFVTITRGCDNMCTFCIVPFTRGRERSRDPKSILKEVDELGRNGYKEITLLGQNVDSYLWYGGGLKKDFSKASSLQQKTAVNFSKLLELVANAQPKMRIRFSTSNPQDMSLDVIHAMAKNDNICNYIHLPVQSGSNNILKKMNRQHTREEYFELIDDIKNCIPDCAISHDMISGFPSETEQDHQDTLTLMKYVKYDFGFMFAYSERPGTMAAKKIEDDIPEPIKKRRLKEVIDLQRIHSEYRTQQFIGKTTCVLIEKSSKRSNEFWSGRTSQNIVAVFPKENYKVGDFVDIKIDEVTSATLIGRAIGISSSI